MKLRPLPLLGGAVMAYLAAYGGFRATHMEMGPRDDRAYVIYPEGAVALYYLFRPMAYADAALTGVGSHLGPHLP
jgi:hypothetical protein